MMFLCLVIVGVVGYMCGHMRARTKTYRAEFHITQACEAYLENSDDCLMLLTTLYRQGVNEDVGSVISTLHHRLKNLSHAGAEKLKDPKKQDDSVAPMEPIIW